MANICSCKTGKGNLGLPNCVDGTGVAERDIYVDIINSDGEFNKIDPSVTIDDAFLEARLNDPDPTKRWYLTPTYKNFTSERADTEYEEFDDGSKERIRKGTRTETYLFAGNNKGYNTKFLSKLAKAECGRVGYFRVYSTKSLGGEVGSDGMLYPVETTAFDTNWNPATDTTVEKVTVSFDLAKSESDTEYGYILGSEIDADFSQYQGLLDVMASNIVPPTAGASGTITLDLKYCYGSLGKESPYLGLVLADVTDVLINGVSATSFDSVVDNGDANNNGGQNYSITFTGVTVATDVVQLVISKTKFDFSTVNETEIIVA